MAVLKVQDRQGNWHEVTADHDQPLMEVLRDGDFGVDGTCGGACSCGTCHVYVDAAWSAKLSAPGEDERLMLEAIAEVAEVRPNSRLSCQILFKDSLSGLSVEIGPVV